MRLTALVPTYRHTVPSARETGDHRVGDGRPGDEVEARRHRPGCVAREDRDESGPWAPSTVTFSTTAAASAGTPPRPATGSTSVEPAGCQPGTDLLPVDGLLAWPGVEQPGRLQRLGIGARQRDQCQHRLRCRAAPLVAIQIADAERDGVVERGGVEGDGPLLAGCGRTRRLRRGQLQTSHVVTRERCRPPRDRRRPGPWPRARWCWSSPRPSGRFRGTRR